VADRDAQLTRAEADVAAAVADALTATAQEFADAVQAATKLVAARFSVGRIAGMWNNRVGGLVRRLLGVSQTAAQAAAEDAGTELPDGWDDLPGRHEDGRPLPDGIGQYATTTEHLLRAVGDRLAEATRRELAAGLDAGEDIGQLRNRLVEAFSREGAQLGPGREHRVSQTEATRAWNTATLAAARAMTGPAHPLVKQWITRRDTRVRDAHDDVDGQLRLLSEPFTVAGVPMDAPGDPSAPPALVCNCRCRLAVAADTRASAWESQAAPPAAFSDAREQRVQAPQTVTAAGGHTGAMIALVPTEEDAQRLALADPGAEPADELHLTLFYLGEGADWDTEHRAELIAGVRDRAPTSPVYGRAFGANQWNADGDDPCWVWAVGDNRDQPPEAPLLEDVRQAAVGALEDMHRQPDLPTQHTPWQPHVCAAYSASPDLLDAMNQRLGPVRFDRIRLAFAGEVHDIPLSPQQEEQPMADQADETAPDVVGPLAAVPWSTPGDTALAFEDSETGDGRVFRPGALYWAGPGPWPLQYADEMLMGHEGAELAGAIQTLGRDGMRITGTGVLYPNRPAGADALMLLEEGAPLGVSVDLDDVSVEFVDRTITDEDQAEDEEMVLLFASLPSASLLRLDDGSWMLSTTSTQGWTASAGGTAMARTAASVQLITGPDGRVSASAVRAALGTAGVLTAAAGDPDTTDGVVVHSENSGDLLMRVTRARLRGATLVAMPAYDQARIVLDVRSEPPRPEGDEDPLYAAAGPSAEHQAVVEYVRSAPIAVGAREVAQALGISMEAVRGHLGRAAQAGRIVRLAPGLYVGPSSLPEGDLTAAVSGDVNLPVHDNRDAPWADEAQAASFTELEASAWSALQQAPPMPAAWFKEPTAEELPPGSGGVHCAGGRVWGWVAQAGEPHAGLPGRVTIESLGKIDLSHFLRARFNLDDGSTVKAGAMTMNVGHHRDGAECETESCQFDDSRTVAGIVTVGMNSGGMWFSGAAAPWLSTWDQQVFAACQPSYHMRKGPRGQWQLRAVLSVPVPGHSSPLVAAAVDRSNLAIAASAAVADTAPDTADTVSGQDPDTNPGVSGQQEGTGPDLPGQRPDTRPDVSGHRALLSKDVDAIATALLTSVPFLDVLLTVLDRRQEQRAETRAEVERLAASVSGTHTATKEDH
jgi:2'-5' RNA ligase